MEHPDEAPPRHEYKRKAISTDTIGSPSKWSAPMESDHGVLARHLDHLGNSNVQIYYNDVPFTRDYIHRMDLYRYSGSAAEACQVLGVVTPAYGNATVPVDIRVVLAGPASAATTPKSVAGPAPKGAAPKPWKTITSYFKRESTPAGDTVFSPLAPALPLPNVGDVESEWAGAEAAEPGQGSLAMDECGGSAAPSSSAPATGTAKKWTEKDAQGMLMEHKEALHLIDSSSKGNPAMAFQLPRDMYSAHTETGTTGLIPNVYTLSARPDGTHTHLPLTLEIKLDRPYALLLQAISRVYAQRCTAAYYKKIVTFAVHPRVAWVVHYSRSGMTERIDIVPTPVESVLKLWQCLESTFPTINHWLSADGPYLLSTLAQLQLSARSTLVFYIGKGVYGVSTVKRYKYGKTDNATVLGASHREPHLCIKVHRNRERFEAEAGALSCIYRKFKTERRAEFYAVGLLDVETNVYHVMPDYYNNAEALHAQAVNIRYRFRYAAQPTVHTFEPPPLELRRYVPVTTTAEDGRFYEVWPGGCIIMQPGKPIAALNGREEAQAWLSAVTRSLRAIHDAGYLHCDVRNCNTMRFGPGNNVQVIDFDLAVSVEEATVELGRDSGQWNGAGERVASICRAAPAHEDSVQVTWTAADDMEMATVALLRLIFPV